jgi:hypothetical protein
MTHWMKTLGLGAALLCLAACGGETPQPKPGAASPDAASEPIVELKAVPAAFQGVWAATAADCDEPAETRLEITADRLRFHESSGAVASVEAKGSDEILVIIPLSGEGGASRRTFRYRLLDGGAGLFDVRNGLERARCPAA